jgi:hypothetical protein
MLPDGRKERLDHLASTQQPRIRLQFQHIQQLLASPWQRNRLQVLVSLQQVMQGHAVALKALIDALPAGHEHRVEHGRHAFHRCIHWQCLPSAVFTGAEVGPAGVRTSASRAFFMASTPHHRRRWPQGWRPRLDMAR